MAIPTAGPRTALGIHLRLGRALVAAAADDDAATIEADFRAAVEEFDAYGSPPYLGTANEEFGRWLADQGRAEEAATYLAAAERIYTQLGATAWLTRLADARIAITR